MLNPRNPSTSCPIHAKSTHPIHAIRAIHSKSMQPIQTPHVLHTVYAQSIRDPCNIICTTRAQSTCHKSCQYMYNPHAFHAHSKNSTFPIFDILGFGHLDFRAFGCSGFWVYMYSDFCPDPKNSVAWIADCAWSSIIQRALHNSPFTLSTSSANCEFNDSVNCE